MSESRPSIRISERPQAESMSFFGCPNPKCSVRHWPINTPFGDRCPGKGCGATGVFIGIMTKIPDPQPGADGGDVQ